jgi:hypothetical protein
MEEIAELPAARIQTDERIKGTNSTLEIFKRRFQTIKPVFDKSLNTPDAPA